MTDTETEAAAFDSARSDLLALRSALTEMMVGQDRLIDEILIAMVAGGHVLMEGLPGLGKTHLAKGVAGLLGLAFARVQCTPDLLPADVTGSEVLAGGLAGNDMEFKHGPIFANVVLVDEINRATPRTQSALLEAMQENQVTYAGRRHPLPHPFLVLATQNPIELEGTYPLPEAQLDRFLLKVNVPYPDAASLSRVLDVSLDRDPGADLEPVLSGDRFTQIMDTARRVVVAEAVKQEAVALVLATQPGGGGDSPAGRHLRYGASPRGLQSLVRAARVAALLDGRAHVAVDDLDRCALPTLRHRVLLNMDSELDGVTADAVLEGILAAWRVRR